MKTILVTGYIGSGKSAVCDVLREEGYPVYNSDAKAKSLYNTVPGLLEKAEEAVGVPFCDFSIIFRNPLKREALEAVVYPALLEDFLAWRDAQAADRVFFESAIALDKPLFEHLFDEVVVVKSPVLRNPYARERLASQSEFKRADYIIDNDSTLEALKGKVKEYLNK